MSNAGEADDATPLTGFYFREARFLSTVRLQIDGQRPWLCEAAAIAPDELQFVYTYANGRSQFEVLRKHGTLHVVRQPPPESLSASTWQRLHGVMESSV